MSLFKQLQHLTLTRCHTRDDLDVLPATVTAAKTSASPLVNLRTFDFRDSDIDIFHCVNPLIANNSLAKLVIRVGFGQSELFCQAYHDLIARSSRSLRELFLIPDTTESIPHVLSGFQPHSPSGLREIFLQLEWDRPHELPVLQALRGPRLHVLRLGKSFSLQNPMTLDKLLEVHATVCSVPSLEDLGVLCLQVHMERPTKLEEDLRMSGCLLLREDHRIVPSPYRGSKSVDERKYTYNISSIFPGAGDVILHIYRIHYLGTRFIQDSEPTSHWWYFAILREVVANNSEHWWSQDDQT